MTYPNFTPDENYLISYVKTPSAGSSSSSYMWGYILSGSLIFGLGVYNESVSFMAIAFAIVIGFRLYEEWYISKWTPKWRSIIEKFEAALSDVNARGNS